MKGDEKCKNWGGLGVRGHPRSSETLPFDRAHMTSYSTKKVEVCANILFWYQDLLTFNGRLAWSHCKLDRILLLIHNQVPAFLCVIKGFAILTQYPLVTNRWTYTGTQKPLPENIWYHMQVPFNRHVQILWLCHWLNCHQQIINSSYIYLVASIRLLHVFWMHSKSDIYLPYHWVGPSTTCRKPCWWLQLFHCHWTTAL